MAGPLHGQVAVVTGASRGVRKGIALGLGEAGATVYVTGRTVQVGTAVQPGTIDETAEQVTRHGGQGIAVRCDHANDADIAALLHRITTDQGRLDLLVNNALATPALMPRGVPFWELPIALWDQLHTVGLRSHYVASVFAAPLLVSQGRGLIVNVSSVGAIQFLFNVPYGVGKAALDRLTADTAHDLRPHGVAVVSLWPGFTTTESVLTNARAFPPGALEGAATPQFSGRAVAALASDVNIMAKTGQALSIFDVMDEYGFTDVDGRRPSSTHQRRATA